MPTKLLARPAAPRRPEDLADGDLLQCFAGRQDEAAFGVLVDRHGPLVLGVCRRILQHSQDAEDAFQATFLILARKAGGIHTRQSLASWLYKVATRIAFRLREMRSRRRERENRFAEGRAGAAAPAGGEDLRGLLDEEVQRLPEKYRAPVLLCYLQGRTNEEAARQLDCPTGTVKIRLLRARELLRKRLTRRGIGLSLAVLLADAAGSARAAVPPHLCSETARAGWQLRAGFTPAGRSARAVRLSDGWCRRLARAKVKLACSLLLTLLMVLASDQHARSTGPDPVFAPKAVPTREVPGPTYRGYDKPDFGADELIVQRRIGADRRRG